MAEVFTEFIGKRTIKAGYGDSVIVVRCDTDDRNEQMKLAMDKLAAQLGMDTGQEVVLRNPDTLVIDVPKFTTDAAAKKADAKKE